MYEFVVMIMIMGDLCKRADSLPTQNWYCTIWRIGAFFCRTRSVTREEKNLSNFLKRPADKWVENSFEVAHDDDIAH